MKIKELLKRRRKQSKNELWYSSNFGKQRPKPKDKMFREHSDK